MNNKVKKKKEEKYVPITPSFINTCNKVIGCKGIET